MLCNGSPLQKPGVGGGLEVGMTTVTKTTEVQTNTDLAPRKRQDCAPTICTRAGADGWLDDEACPSEKAILRAVSQM